MNRKVKAFLKKPLKKTFALAGFKLKQVDRGFPELWSRSPEFQTLFDQIVGHTIVDEDRCFMLYQLARSTNSLGGNAAEVGVYRGGTGKLLAKTCPKKTVYLFDTFAGEPPEDPEVDYHRKGDLANTSVESVRELCRDCDNVKIFPGLFPRDTGETIKDKLFSFVHVDVGLYRSIRDTLSFFYDKMVPGGVVLVEGYEWWACPGAKRAVTEFLADRPEIPVMTARYQCMFAKCSQGRAALQEEFHSPGIRIASSRKRAS